MSLENSMEEEARLAILKELAKEDNRAMSSARMQKILLHRLLIDKPREWVERQYLYLRDMRAVTVVQADTVKIARLSDRGDYHLRGLVIIPGILEPSVQSEY